MASLPLQPASWRQSSSDQADQAEQAAQAEQTPAAVDSASQTPRSHSHPRSTRSEDSQTVFLNTPVATESPKAQDAKPSSRPHDLDSDVKKCWICFADETEDTPESSAWRDPCPCALVAHEDCLLDWIADMESPSSRKRTLGPPQLLCPQCKSKIHLARPRDAIVEVVRASERLAAKAMLPAALAAVAGIIVHACSYHGQQSICAIFGYEDGERILAPILKNTHWFGGGVSFRNNLTEFSEHWRLRVGLPLITPLLILSRTSYADSILPVFPVILFATHGDSDQPMQFGHWPPSASLAMAVLPYVKKVYSMYYEGVWAPHEKRWLKEIQPRQASSNDNDELPDDGGDDDLAGEDDGFEIRVGGNLWDDWDGRIDAEEPIPDLEPALDGLEQGQRQERRNQLQEWFDNRRREMQDGRERRNNGTGNDPEIAPPLDMPPLEEEQEAPAPNVPRNIARPPPAMMPLNEHGQVPPQAPPPVARAERRLSISTTVLAETVMGALIFPAIASLSGEALRMLLPASWVMKAGKGRATGLLQEKWGRSVVGGCLFVVFKDAVMLYVRWKMAQQHRKRRVLDYDRKKGRKVGGR